MKPWLKRRKNLEFCETLLPDLRLEEEYNYNILLRMTSENSKEIFQLISDISTENAKLRELILPRLQLLSTGYNFYQQATTFINRGVIQELWLWVLFFVINFEEFNIYVFSPFVLFIFSSLMISLIFLLSTKALYKKQITWFKLVWRTLFKV